MRSEFLKKCLNSITGPFIVGLLIVLIYPMKGWAQTQNGANPVLTILNPTLTSPTEPITVVLNYCPNGYNSSQLVIQVNNTSTVSNPQTITQCSVPMLGSYLWVDARGYLVLSLEIAPDPF